MRHTCKGEFGSQAGMESVDVVQSMRINFEASSAPLEKIRFTLPLYSTRSTARDQQLYTNETSR